MVDMIIDQKMLYANSDKGDHSFCILSSEITNFWELYSFQVTTRSQAKGVIGQHNLICKFRLYEMKHQETGT